MNDRQLALPAGTPLPRLRIDAGNLLAMECMLAGAGGNQHRLMNPQRGCTPTKVSSKSMMSWRGLRKHPCIGHTGSAHESTGIRTPASAIPVFLCRRLRAGFSRNQLPPSPRHCGRAVAPFFRRRVPPAPNAEARYRARCWVARFRYSCGVVSRERWREMRYAVTAKLLRPAN